MASGPPVRLTRFGDLLREHRLAAGFSQEHLANVARMSVTAIGALERGVRLAPYRATVDLLAGALGLGDGARAEFETAANQARGRGRQNAKRTPARHNLPPPQTAFVGREIDLSRLRGLVLRQRRTTITITGSGGVGKSRLALEAAGAMLDDFSEGVWLVQLAWITDAEFVPNSIASVLGIQGSPDRSATETLVQALRRRKLLLILDNCEHVLETATATVAALERMCPSVVVLATSREPLGLPREINFALAPLETPPGVVASLDEALTFPAVDLFGRRAATLGAGVFDLNDQNVGAVVEIVRRLDGLPLAIELAVPKLQTLSVNALAIGLQNRFELLVDEHQSALPRHRALWALIDWSYELLSDDEKFVLESCSIFAGPFTIDAVVAVAARDPLSDTTLYGAFTSLVTKSLINVTGRIERRYGMLETIREYARDRIGDNARIEALRRKHAEHYLKFARRVDRSSQRATQLTTLRALAAERSNIDAALTWSIEERSDPRLGAQLCAALFTYLQHADTRSRNWVRLALRDIDSSETPELFADLTFASGALFMYEGEYGKHLENAERAIRIYRANEDPIKLCRALISISHEYRQAAALESATEAADEAVSLARRIAEPRLLGLALYAYGQCYALNEPDRAAAQFRECLEVYNPDEPDVLVSMTLSAMAELEYRAGRCEVALDLTKRAAILLEPEPDLYRLYRAVILGEYSAYALTLGEMEAGREAAREALHTHLQLGLQTLPQFPIQHLALASALLGNARRAALLLGYCIKATEHLAPINLGIDKGFRDRALAIVSSQLSSTEMDALLATGAMWSEDRAAEEAFLV